MIATIVITAETILVVASVLSLAIIVGAAYCFFKTL